MKLSPEQQLVVDSRDPVLAVLAGAGSGKTATIVARISAIVAEGVAPRRILAITFTNKAAEELTDRLDRAGVQGVDVGTIHAWCARILRSHADEVQRTPNFSIYDEDDVASLVRWAADGCGMQASVVARTGVEKLLQNTTVRSRYLDLLRAGDAFDFDTLESTTIHLLETSERARGWLADRYDEVLFDEHQDTNAAQVALASYLKPMRFVLVGDPRQAIYRWRGASSTHFEEQATSAGVRRASLRTCYRSHEEIVDIANFVMMDEDSLVSARGPGGSVRGLRAHALDEGVVAAHESLGRPRPGSVAVLCRTWRSAEVAHSALRAANIPATLHRKDVDVWSTDAGKYLLAALAMVHRPDDHATAKFVLSRARFLPAAPGERAPRLTYNDLRRQAPGRLFDEVAPSDVVSLMRRYTLAEHKPSAWQVAKDFLDVDGHAALAELGLQNRIDDLEACVSDLAGRRGMNVRRLLQWAAMRGAQDVGLDADTVHVMTVHAAKGLEWDHVIVVDAIDGVYPGRRSVTEEDVLDDRRLLYVAITRARDHLVLLAHDTEDREFGPPVTGLEPTPMVPVVWERA